MVPREAIWIRGGFPHRLGGMVSFDTIHGRHNLLRIATSDVGFRNYSDPVVRSRYLYQLHQV